MRLPRVLAKRRRQAGDRVDAFVLQQEETQTQGGSADRAWLGDPVKHGRVQRSRTDAQSVVHRDAGGMGLARVEACPQRVGHGVGELVGWPALGWRRCRRRPCWSSVRCSPTSRSVWPGLAQHQHPVVADLGRLGPAHHVRAAVEPGARRALDPQAGAARLRAWSLWRASLPDLRGAPRWTGVLVGSATGLLTAPPRCS